jgi:hypothetical protein
MKSASAIAFDYRPSGWLAAAAVLIFCAALAAPWLSALPFAIALGISAAAGAIGILSLHRFLRPPFRRIAYRASGWILVDANGVEKSALLRLHARLGAWISLDFELDRRRRFRAMLGPDNLDAETRRRLVLMLARADVAHAA